MAAAGPDAVLAADPVARAGELRSRFRAILSHPSLARARYGIVVRRRGDEQAIVDISGETPLIPASNLKLVTTAAALTLLGRDYAFQTRFVARGNVSDHVLHGDLVVIGGGDPGISGRFAGEGAGAAVRLDEVAATVRDKGITRIEGRLVLDDRFFDRLGVHPSWPRNQLDNWYCAPTGALSLNDNCVDITVGPADRTGTLARVGWDPHADCVAVRNLTATVADRSQHRFRVERSPGSNDFTVRGRIWVEGGELTTNVTVADPTRFFGSTFRAALHRAGITISGGMVRLESDDRSGRPETELATLRTPLAQAVEVCNKRSQNFYAEQILKTIGRERNGEGSWPSGTAAVAGFLIGLGCEPMEAGGGSSGSETGDFRLADGSGLSRGNRLSARAIAAVLDAMIDHPARAELFTSLPIAGADGSLEKRMREGRAAGRVVAKTGYIAGASALSGYANGLDGGTYTFSFLFNRFKGSNAELKRIQDRLCEAIIEWSGAGEAFAQ